MGKILSLQFVNAPYHYFLDNIIGLLAVYIPTFVILLRLCGDISLSHFTPRWF